MEFDLMFTHRGLLLCRAMHSSAGPIRWQRVDEIKHFWDPLQHAYLIPLHARQRMRDKRTLNELVDVKMVVKVTT